MASARLACDLQTLYTAPDVAQLRRRLCDGLAVRGYSGVAEYSTVRRDERSVFDLAWDNADEWTGGRRDALVRGWDEASAARGQGEERRRLRWRAAQKRPYLCISGAPVRFQGHTDIINLCRDFGLNAFDTLVVPLPPGSQGPCSIGTVAERKADLRNVTEVMALITTYYHMSRVHDAKNDNRPEAEAAASEEAVQLTEKERKVLRWAAAGKTHQDIADIIGIPMRNVRYHIDRARERYGYATAQQTVVRAALDYGFDPLGRH